MNRFITLSLVLVLLFGCDKEITRSEELIESPVNGKIFIASDPPGSNIYINDKIQGVSTPDSISWLPEEELSITLKRPLYRDTTFTLIASAKKTDSVFVDYFANPTMYGRIRCDTKPAGAEIFLNGVSTGKYSPDTLVGLIPGYYKVVYKKNGFRSLVLDYRVTSNETVGAFYTLEDTTIWVSYNLKNSGILEDRVLAVENDLEGNIWFASDLYGLCKYDRINWKVFTTADHPVFEYATYSLAVDSSNTLWIGSSQGLLSYRDNIFTYYNTSNSELPADQVYHLKVDKFNRVWVSTYGGIVMIENDIFTVFSKENNNTAAEYVNCVEPVDVNTVFAGHVKSVMTRMYQGLFVLIIPEWDDNSSDFNIGTTVETIAYISEQEMWVGFYPEYRPGGGLGGLALVKDGIWYNDFQFQISREIHEIFVDRRGTKYVCTTEGLTIFDNWEIRENYNKGNSGLYNSKINDICQDNSGDFWLATDGGLTKYKRFR